MKRRDVISQIKALGWYLFREGGNHSIYAHATWTHHIPVSHHSEINEHTARGILKSARGER